MVQAPSGVVTLAVTDIEKSTELWAEAPTAMEEALKLHDASLRALIDAHGGYEVKAEGDGFKVAFDTPLRAVRWCLRVQETLMELPWPADLLACGAAAKEEGFCGLRVRMGVHMGTPTPIENPVTQRMDYFGPMANRAARIGSAPHGGQLVVSQRVWNMVAEELGLPGEDLGDHRLKGLERLERLYQVQPESLSFRRFQPLNTLDMGQTNLPAQLASFFGRETELEELAGFFSANAHLVTLSGPGGTGKTRLALRFGAHEFVHYSGGVWFCDLTEVRTLEGLSHAVGKALGIPLGADGSPERLGRVLSKRGPTLLIMDNFEQVLEYAPATVGHWLSVARELRVLATSRERLHLVGEQVMPIEPLPVLPSTLEGISLEDLEANPAVMLFEKRAHEANPEFALDESNREAVAGIISWLDGIPLAIELAAARSRMMVPGVILERLRASAGSELQMLSAGSRDALGRKATMLGAILWSWDLLESWEQSALAQCGVFCGGFTLPAAEEVLDLSGFVDAPMTLDVLQSLVDKSLLRSWESEGQGVRLGMYQTIRSFLAGKLEVFPGEEDSGGGVVDQEADAEVPDADGEGSLSSVPGTGLVKLTGCEVDLVGCTVNAPKGVRSLTQIEVALLGYFFTHPGRAIPREELLREVWEYRGGVVSRAVDHAVKRLRSKVETNPNEPQHIRTVHGVGYRYDPLTAVAVSETVDGASEPAPGNQKPRGRSGLSEGSRIVRADVEARHGVFYAAMAGQAGVDALHVFGGAEKRRELSLELENLVIVAERGLVGGDSENAVSCCMGAMAVINQRGPLDFGIELGERVLELDDLDVETRTGLLLVYGWSLLLGGRLDEAFRALSAALEQAREQEHFRYEGDALMYLAIVARRQSNREQAREHVEAALLIYRNLGAKRREADALSGLAHILWIGDGDPVEARRLFDDALGIYQAVGDRSGEALALTNLAVLGRELGDQDAALEYGESALQTYRDLGDLVKEGRVLGNMGNLHVARGSLDQAQASLEEALLLHRKLGNHQLEGHTLGNLGDLWLVRQDLESARGCIEGALVCVREVSDKRAEGAFLGSLSELERLSGHLDEAREAAALGGVLLREIGDLYELGKLLCRQGLVEVAAKREKDARAVLEEATECARSLGVAETSELGVLVEALSKAVSVSFTR